MKEVNQEDSIWKRIEFAESNFAKGYWFLKSSI